MFALFVCKDGKIQKQRGRVCIGRAFPVMRFRHSEGKYGTKDAKNKKADCGKAQFPLFRFEEMRPNRGAALTGGKNAV